MIQSHAWAPHSFTSRERLPGVYPALVTDVADPDNQGRVEVQLPWVEAQDSQTARVWARLATFMAGGSRGSWFIPEIGDEVVISYVAGDPRWPVVLGALWNGADAPPESMDSGGENNLRSITSRSGHRLTFDDTAGAQRVELKTQGGHSVLLNDGEQSIKITHSGGATIEIDAAGGISITALSQVSVDAPAGMTVTAAQVTVNAPASTFNGLVKCQTLVTESVISPLYTPGAGNIL